MFKSVGFSRNRPDTFPNSVADPVAERYHPAVARYRYDTIQESDL